MDRYTIEDVELVRRKSGISYEEAVNLLEYHNGNLAKALVDLERNGRIRDKVYADEKNAAPRIEGKEKAMNLVQKLYQTRLMVKKDDTTIVNLSLLFSIPFAVIFPYAAVICLVVIFILGYRIRINRKAAGFSDVHLDKMVKNAAQNVKDTLSDLTKEISSEQSKPSAYDNSERSYYRGPSNASSPADQTTSAPSVGTSPVIVHCNEDGNVNISQDSNGYNKASIE